MPSQEETTVLSYQSQRSKVPTIRKKVDQLAPLKGSTPKDQSKHFRNIERGTYTVPASTRSKQTKPKQQPRVSVEGVPFFRPVRAVETVEPESKQAPAKPKKKQLPRDYKGDVHFVVDLEGIGPAYEKKLHGAKIYNTQELLFASDKKLQKVTGAPAKTIQNWKNMCQLVKVKGIGPQFAELMVRAGIGGLEELKTLDPEASVVQVKEYEAGLKTKVTGSGIGVKRLTTWQKQAKKMRKVAIDLKKIEVIDLESRQAIANVNKGEKKKPSRAKAARNPKGSYPTEFKSVSKK